MRRFSAIMVETVKGEKVGLFLHTLVQHSRWEGVSLTFRVPLSHVRIHSWKKRSGSENKRFDTFFSVLVAGWTQYHSRRMTGLSGSRDEGRKKREK